MILANWREMKMNKQSGIASILVIIFIFSLLTGVWYLTITATPPSILPINLEVLKRIKLEIPFLSSKTSFGKLPNVIGLPEIINNDSVYALDKIFDDVENNIDGEDLSDLEL